MSESVGSGRNSSIIFLNPVGEQNKIPLESQLKPMEYQPYKPGSSIKMKSIPYDPNLLPNYNQGLQQQQPQQQQQNFQHQERNGNQINGNQQGHLQQQNNLIQAANIIQREAQPIYVPANGFSGNQIYQPQPSGQVSGLYKSVVREQKQKRLITQKQILIELFLFILEVKKKHYNIAFEVAKKNSEILSLIYAIECYKIKKQWLSIQQREIMSQEEKQFFQFWKIEKEKPYFQQIYQFFIGEDNEYDLEQDILIDTTFGDKILNWQLSDKEIDSTYCIIQLIDQLNQDNIDYVQNTLPETAQEDYEQKIRQILKVRQINLLQMLCIFVALKQRKQQYQLQYVQQMMGQDSIFKNIEIFR